MKKKIFSIIAVILAFQILIQSSALAAAGDAGFEGGISSWDSDGKTAMKYKEVCFITGEPIVFEGDLIVKTTSSKNSVTSKYTYSLTNVKNSTDTLKRSLTLTTNKTTVNNQISEVTTITKPTETIKIGSRIYALDSYTFSKTAITEDKPAVDYYSGKLSSEKIYTIDSDSANTIKIETTGDIYGYQQYWGNIEAQKLIQTITNEKVSNGETSTTGIGTANINISSGMSRNLQYSENEPQVISFEGGFIQSEQNESILEYSARLTDSAEYINDYNGTLKIGNAPTLKSFASPGMYKIKGHWSEQYINEMYSLNIFNESANEFNPDDYITKAEFIAAMVNAVKYIGVPQTTSTTTKTPTIGGKKPTVISPFTDLDVSSKYYSKINDALNMGLINGKGDGTLGANDYLIMADTLTIFINALGLENTAPGENPVTYFKDNDQIPSYARRPAYISQKIGLIKGDDKGLLNPNSYISKAQAATLISRFIQYLQQDIRKDYRDKIVGFSN